MALFSAIKKKSILKASIRQTAVARNNGGAKADQLFISAYNGYADVVRDDLLLADALFNWGFALLHQAKTKQGDTSSQLYLDSIDKFKFCLLVVPNHLGAAIDGGVAYMDLARVKKVKADHEYYDLAKLSFENAERIQKGSAAFNLACICSLRGQQEACLEALEVSKEYGSLPAAEDIVNDADMEKVKETKWFADFMERATAEPEPEVVDENAVVYDEEGKIVKEKGRDDRKFPETEVDGVVYGAEGNIVRIVTPEVKKDTKEKPAIKAKVVTENTEKPVEVEKTKTKTKDQSFADACQYSQKKTDQVKEQVQVKE